MYSVHVNIKCIFFVECDVITVICGIDNNDNYRTCRHRGLVWRPLNKAKDFLLGLTLRLGAGHWFLGMMQKVPEIKPSFWHRSSRNLTPPTRQYPQSRTAGTMGHRSTKRVQSFRIWWWSNPKADLAHLTIYLLPLLRGLTSLYIFYLTHWSSVEMLNTNILLNAFLSLNIKLKKLRSEIWMREVYWAEESSSTHAWVREGACGPLRALWGSEGTGSPPPGSPHSLPASLGQSGPCTGSSSQEPPCPLYPGTSLHGHTGFKTLKHTDTEHEHILKNNHMLQDGDQMFHSLDSYRLD